MEKLAVYEQGMTREQKLSAVNDHKDQILKFMFKEQMPNAEMSKDFPRAEMTDFQLDPKNNGSFLAKMELFKDDLGNDDSIQYFDISVDEENELVFSLQNVYLSPEQIAMKERESFGEYVEPVESDNFAQYDLSEILEAELTKSEPSIDEMSNAYAEALILQERYGFQSDTVEWNNPKLIKVLHETDPALVDYFNSLDELNTQYDQMIQEVGTWKEQPESLTKDDIKKKEQFSRFINQLELFQNGPMTELDSDLLKASYTKETEYHVVFGVDFDNKNYGQRTGLESANHQIYDAVYKGGEIVSLHPENEALMEHLQTDKEHPYNIITENDKSYLLSFSNEFVKNIEEYHAIIDDLKSVRSDPASGFEQVLNDAMHKETPVERLESLRNMIQEISKSTDKFARMDQILLDVHPVMKEIVENNDFREEVQSDMERLYRKFNNPELFTQGKFSELRVLREVATQLTSLEMQNVRYQGLEGQLFKNPEQAVIFSRFDEMKPFKLSVSAEPTNYQGASNFFETLNKEAINDPKEIVQHYAKIVDSISHYEEISNYTKVDMVRLSDYAEQALQETSKVLEVSFEKDYPASPEIDLTLKSEIDFNEKYEGQFKIEEAYEKIEPILAIAKLPKDQDLSILNIASSDKLNWEEKEFWNKKAIEMIQNHAGRPFQVSPEKTEQGIFKIDYSNVKQSLEQLKDSHFRNNSFGQPRIENQMLAYINKLEKEQGPLKEVEQKQEQKQEAKQEKKQLVEMER